MDTPGSQRQNLGATLEGGQRVTAKLSKLPKPKNEFELVMPDDEEEDEAAHDEASVCFQ